MKNIASFILLCIFGFAGGIFSDQYLRPAFADSKEAGISRFFDTEGRSRIDIGVHNGQAMQDIYGADGKLRLQFGTYDGSVRMSEKGLPSLTLYDNEGRLRLLFRLDGPNEGPLIIMKDKSAQIGRASCRERVSVLV